jgi:hypothetical protein
MAYETKCAIVVLGLSVFLVKVFVVVVVVVVVVAAAIAVVNTECHKNK